MSIKMSNPWLSIIIPMFNPPVDQLKTCLKSLEGIEAPTEILLIDDGSNPYVNEFCSAIKSEKIRYIYQKNQGVSTARNTGITYARGQYILFVDADDCITLEFCHFLNRNYEKIAEDWALFNILERNAESRTTRKREIFKNDCLLSKEDIANLIYPINQIPECWGKLIKRSFIIEHNILLPSDLIQGEDSVFNKRIAAVVHTAKGYTCEAYIYNEAIRNETRLKKYPEKYLKGLEISYREDLKYIESAFDISKKTYMYDVVNSNFVWNIGSNVLKMQKAGILNSKNLEILYEILDRTEVTKTTRLRSINSLIRIIYYILLKWHIGWGFKILALFKNN